MINLIYKLRNRFSVFASLCDEVEDDYLAYGAFGSFFVDIISLYMTKKIEFRNFFYGELESICDDDKKLKLI